MYERIFTVVLTNPIVYRTLGDMLTEVGDFQDVESGARAKLHGASVESLACSKVGSTPYSVRYCCLL